MTACLPQGCGALPSRLADLCLWSVVCPSYPAALGTPLGEFPARTKRERAAESALGATSAQQVPQCRHRPPSFNKLHNLQSRFSLTKINKGLKNLPRNWSCCLKKQKGFYLFHHKHFPPACILIFLIKSASSGDLKQWHSSKEVSYKPTLNRGEAFKNRSSLDCPVQCKKIHHYTYIL